MSTISYVLQRFQITPIIDQNESSEEINTITVFGSIAGPQKDFLGLRHSLC